LVEFVLFLTPSEVALYNYPGALVTIFTGINSSGVISGFYYDGEAFHALIVATSMSDE
jgi:hypothetical protein